MRYLFLFLVSFLISLILTPLIKKISVLAGTYAKQNHRTIHHGKISRIGGIAIYISFCICMGLFVNVDRSTLGIFLASSCMFFTGLFDDFFDMAPMKKLALQILAACILISFGVRTDSIHLPFGIVIESQIVSVLFTLVWVVGIINAINLTDGLDGLAGGMSVVIFGLIAAISIVDQRPDIIQLSMIIIGAIFGFLVFNAHPASIFMGDCGSLFVGCLIASISLLGFKSSTVMTLALPILILILPIVDTLSAILRRKLKGVQFSEADKEHMHHQLMRRFGQSTTVIIMCGITFLFGMCAFLYIYNRYAGLVMMMILIVLIDIFIEKTGMISSGYRPILSFIYDLFFKNRKGK